MANRNRKEMNNSLFIRLTDYASENDLEIENADKIRFIRRLNEDDAKLMAQAEVSSLVVTRQIRLVRIEWDGSLFFCVFGLPEPEVLPTGLEIVDLTPGTFTISILEAKVTPNATVSEIRNAIESDYFVNGNGYEGHDLDVIVPLFPKAILYKRLSACDYLEHDERVLGSLVAKTYLDGPLHLEPDTINSLSEVFEAGVEFIPYSNILQGLLSISWANLFLETYRCLEQLYAQPRVSDLRAAWNSKLPLREVAALLENHLSWRPKEEEALIRLLQNCDQMIVLSACQSLAINIKNTAADKVSESAAREIYKLRNNIVHYRPAHSTVAKRDVEWNAIVRDMLDIISEIYTKLGAVFFEPIP